MGRQLQPKQIERQGVEGVLAVLQAFSETTRETLSDLNYLLSDGNANHKVGATLHDSLALAEALVEELKSVKVYDTIEE